MIKLDAGDIAELGDRAEQMIAELGAISAEPDRLVRLFLTPEHRQAADVVAGWMRAAGMTPSEDALGTVRGHWPGRAGPAARCLLIGSHIDTVLDAGRYDGIFGVVAGILAVERVARAGLALPGAIDVLAFGDEEGSRFPSTLSSSAAVAGCFDRAALALTDGRGVTFADALVAYGKSPADISAAAYRGDAVAAYVEVHIEQGPVLEEAGQPLGIVTGIVGHCRMRAVVTGQAGHAGTVPMRLRRDALAAAMDFGLRLESIARENMADAMVATVGRLDVFPGSANVIPGCVAFSVDLRSMTDEGRRAAWADFSAEARRIAAARGVDVRFEPLLEVAATPCASGLQETFATALADLGCAPIRLPSGAGHDAQMMARLCPAAMLFVRCRGGVSHNPAEFASPADMGLAVAALIRFIERFAASR
ncbi:MAG TPA: allantoate amidohydrolase [Xanthobacteraceae bacterium]|nr:allantoate amidohydrolase [Xanthobacteraceae bacterium]